MENKYKNRILLSCMCVIITGLILTMASHVLGDKYDDKNVINEKAISQKETNSEKDIMNIEDELTAKLRSSFEDEYVIDMAQYPVVPASALKIIYDRNMSVEVKGSDYSIIFNGEDITDYSRELDTVVEFEKVDDGYRLTRDVSNIIPGEVVFKVSNKEYKGKYIYIYNKTQGKYMLLSDDGKGIIQLGNNEEYLIIDKKLYEFKLDYKWFMYVGAGMGILMLIYVLVKKRYWFW